MVLFVKQKLTQANLDQFRYGLPPPVGANAAAPFSAPNARLAQTSLAHMPTPAEWALLLESLATILERIRNFWRLKWNA